MFDTIPSPLNVGNFQLFTSMPSGCDNRHVTHHLSIDTSQSSLVMVISYLSITTFHLSFISQARLFSLINKLIRYLFSFLPYSLCPIRCEQRFRLIKDGHLPWERGKETWDFQRICTGFVAPRDQRLGERQRRTAWWARHSKDTANDHWYKRACIGQTTRQLFLAVWTSWKERQQKCRYRTLSKLETLF